MRNIFNNFLNRVTNFPIWVKQIILVKLYEDIKSQTCENFANEKAEDIFSLYTPILTYKGRKELDKNTFDSNIHNFLVQIEKGFNIAEISLNTYFSIEEVAKYFLFCLEQEYVEKPENVKILAMTEFIGEKIRTGEYFVKTGAITQDQLEKVLNENCNEKFAEKLVKNGFLKSNDVKGIISIKEDSKKRFVLDFNDVPEYKNDFCEKEDAYKSELEILKKENESLKTKISQLSELVK